MKTARYRIGRSERLPISFVVRYAVYILTNAHKTVFYVGVTNDLVRRVFQHKVKMNKGFTNKYNCDRLVYFEEYDDIGEAIHREKQLKKYHRSWKLELIEGMNPGWKDLSEGWYDQREFEHFIRE